MTGELIGRHYRHSKTGGLYTVINIGIIEKTDELAVIYQSNSDHRIWIRSYDEFFEYIRISDDLDKSEVPRFVEVRSY